MGMVRSQFETETCLRLKLFEIGFDFFKFAESTTALPYRRLQVEFTHTHTSYILTGLQKSK